MTSFLVLFRAVGYGLLLLTLFDVISAFAVSPSQFGNPGWQFQTAGGFVERSAVPLIGFILVFYDNLESRKKRESIVLRLLSWIALLSGVFYFALVVVFFLNAPTLNEQGQKQLDAQFEPRIAQAKLVQSELKKLQPAQIEAAMKANRITGDPQAFKATQEQNAATQEKNLTLQSTLTSNDRRLTLIKSAVKWALGALVTGVLFVRIWAGTDWAR